MSESGPRVDFNVATLIALPTAQRIFEIVEREIPLNALPDEVHREGRFMPAGAAHDDRRRMGQIVNPSRIERDDVPCLFLNAGDDSGSLPLVKKARSKALTAKGRNPEVPDSPVDDHYHNRRPLISARRSPIRNGFFKTAP
jgi:hypothetical protein